MRIHRLDLQEYRGLSGTFRFPAEGVGLWCSANEEGKSALARAVVDALYGGEGPGWIRMGFHLDSGEAFHLTRDLEKGRAGVIDRQGKDVTSRFEDEDGIGGAVFGLSRRTFEAVFACSIDTLLETIQNPALASWLAGTGDESGAHHEPPIRPAPPDPELEIVRLVDEAAAEPSGAGAAEDSVGYAGRVDLPDPDEPGLSPVERLHRLRDRLLAAERDEARRQAELRELDERARDRQAEARLLENLAGSEPEDVERLAGIVQGLSEAENEKARLRTANARHLEELSGRGIDPDKLADLDQRVRALPEESRAFLEDYRRAATIRRGTRALTLTEQRFDDSRLSEIEESRRRAARVTVWPLSLAAIGLAGAIANQVLPTRWIPLQASLVLGFSAAVLGVVLLRRAHRLRNDEQVGVLESQARKQAQLEELDGEESRDCARLEKVAAQWGADPDAVLEQLDDWTEHAGELGKIAELKGLLRESEHREAEMREQLGRYAATASGRDLSDSQLVDPQALYADYVRYFQLRQEVHAAETSSAELEAALAGIETSRVEWRDRIDAMLQAAGIEPGRDLAEAVEMFALRSARGMVESTPGEGATGPSLPEECERRIAERAAQLLRAIRGRPCAFRVGPGLSVHVRPDSGADDEDAPWLDVVQLSRTLSAGTMDQVCLALRLAIGETPGPSGEKIPVFLDDALARADDKRHDRALACLAEDAAGQRQVVLLTAHQVRVKWFLHQFPEQGGSFRSIEDAPSRAPSPSSPVSSSPV